MKQLIFFLFSWGVMSVRAQSVKLIDSGSIHSVYTVNGKMIYLNQERLYFSNGRLAQTASINGNDNEWVWMDECQQLKGPQKDYLIWIGPSGQIISTDGTKKGVTVLWDSGFSGMRRNGLSQDVLSVFENRAYFSNYNNLYETDGTKQGTRLIASDLAWHETLDNVLYIKKDSFLLYFSENNSVFRLKSINLYLLNSEVLIDSLSPFSLFNASNIYNVKGNKLSPVIAADLKDEYHLYLTNGTQAHTKRIQRVSNAEGNLLSAGIYGLNDTFYYVSEYKTAFLWKFHNQSNSLVNLYQYAGSGAIETAMGWVVPIGVLSNQSIVTTGYSKAHSFELWHSDGTPENTRLLMDINPGKDSSLPRILLTANGKAYFRATTPTAGRELWVTDGTSTGTKMLLDGIPGRQSGFPDDFSGTGPLRTFILNTFDTIDALYSNPILGIDTRNDSIYTYADLPRKPINQLNYFYRNDSQIAISYMTSEGQEVLVSSLDKKQVRYLTFNCPIKPVNTLVRPFQVTSNTWVFHELTDDQWQNFKLWWYGEGKPCEYDDRLTINPNPASDELRVLFEMPLPKDAVLRIYNQSGNVIREEPLPQNMSMGWRVFDISDIKPGMYIIQVQSDSLNKAARWIKI